jgi:F0F1-type ATP synthase membrane subunit b/b'
VTHAQTQVDQAQKVLTRAEASLKACAEKARAIKDKLARQIEEAADEESCETAAQRIYRMAHA